MKRFFLVCCAVAAACSVSAGTFDHCRMRTVTTQQGKRIRMRQCPRSASPRDFNDAECKVEYGDLWTCVPKDYDEVFKPRDRRGRCSKRYGKPYSCERH